MAQVNIAKGQKILKRGDKLKEISIILKGSVRQVTKTDEWKLDSGCMVGIMDVVKGISSCDYYAQEDCTLYNFPYHTTDDLEKIFKTQIKYAHMFVIASAKQTALVMTRYGVMLRSWEKFYNFCNDMYQEYTDICLKLDVAPKELYGMDKMQPFESENSIEPWNFDYYAGLGRVSMQKVQQFYEGNIGMCIGEVLNGSVAMHSVAKLIDEIKNYIQSNRDVLFNESRNDMLSLYFDLQCKCTRDAIDCPQVFENMDKVKTFITECRYFAPSLIEERFEEYSRYENSDSAELSEAMEDVAEIDCLEKILMYAYFDTDKIEETRGLIESFKKVSDKFSTSDDVRKIRRSLTNIFFEVYEAVFKRSLEEKHLSSIIRMFLNFGFMDTELVGVETARELQHISEHMEKFKAENVYTMYEWLKSIYYGKNEPSKNEFDLDYAGNLTEMRKNGDIDKAQQEKMQTDVWAKTQFEIRNAFKSTSKVTYGKFSTYMPILCDFDVLGSAEKMLVTVDTIEESINHIRNIDFSVFYREVIFSDPGRDINSYYIQKEVLPQIILLPNAGSKAIMWQETAGTRRDTPARILFPIMSSANVQDLMIENAGRFRWEMCRKIQGVRWNDIREHSLTSDYCDYIQFYRKNHDLSPEAREKIKLTLTRAKNNYREVFVEDYKLWLNYESKGSFRMNKVARDIVFKYCPFANEIRKKVGTSPMYSEMFNKYDILKERKVRQIESVYLKYKQNGGEITKDLQDNLDFYQL